MRSCSNRGVIRLLLLSLCTLVLLPLATDDARGQPDAACGGPFNGWVSGVGRVTAVTRTRIMLRWEIATDGTAVVGGTGVTLAAGCHYRLLTGRDVTPADPVALTLRITRRTRFVADVRPRRGQIITFMVTGAGAPLPGPIYRAPARWVATRADAQDSLAAIIG